MLHCAKTRSVQHDNRYLTGALAAQAGPETQATRTSWALYIGVAAIALALVAEAIVLLVRRRRQE